MRSGRPWVATAVAAALLAAGAAVRVDDPEGMREARKMLYGVTWCEDAYEALEGADAAALLTEWNEFRALSPDRLKSAMKGSVILDLRNVWDPAAMRAAGFTYSSIGRP